MGQSQSINSSVPLILNICFTFLVDPESISSDFAKPMKATQTTETKERKVGKNNPLLSQNSPILHEYLSITDVRRSKSVSLNVSLGASGSCRIWVNDDSQRNW